MGSKKKQATVLVGLLLISAVFGFALFSVGITGLSLDRVDFESTSAFFNEPTWVLFFTQSIMGQHVSINSGVIDNTQIADNGNFANSDMRFTITNTEQSCSYSQNIKQPDQVYDFGYKTYSVYVPFVTMTDAEAQADCSQYGEVFFFGNPLVPDQFLVSRTPLRYCVYGALKTSEIRDISTPTYTFETTFSLEKLDEEPIIRTISTTKTDKTSVKFDDKAYVKWIGNFGTGEKCPSMAPFVAIADTNKEWSLVSTYWYGLYVDSKVSELTKLNNVGLSGGDVLAQKANMQGIINSMNYFSKEVMNNRRTEMVTEDVAVKIDLWNGKMFAPLEKAIEVPSFVAYIKGSWIGFEQPVPKPVITFNDVYIESGRAVVSFLIGNVGESGTVEAGLTCASPIFVEDAPFPVSVPAGGTSKVSFTVVSNNPELYTTETSCTAAATTVTGTVTKVAYVHTDPMKICSPRTLECSNSVLMECKPDGTGWLIKENCVAAGEVCDPATLTCVNKQPGCGDGIVQPGEDCNNCPDDVACLYTEVCGDPDGDLVFDCIKRGCGNGVCELGEKVTCPEDCTPALTRWERFLKWINLRTILCGEGIAGTVCAAALPAFAGFIGAVMAALYIRSFIPLPPVVIIGAILAFFVSFALAAFVLQWWFIGIGVYLIYLMLPYLTKKKRRR